MIGPGGVVGAVVATGRGGLRAKTTIVEGGGDLSAGTLTVASAGATSVDWTATDATGGSESYTYQLHRSQTQGFTPGVGTEVSGATSLTGTDTGLTENTTYYYVMEYDDGSNTVFSDEQSATPTTVTAFFEDGFESGDLTHTEGGFSWGSSGGNVNVVSTLQDGASPHSGSNALEFFYEGPSTQKSAELRFAMSQPGHSDLWIEYWLRFPTNYEHQDDPGGSDNNKMFRLWSGGNLAYGDSGRIKVGAEFHRIGDGHSNGRFMMTPDGQSVIVYLSQMTAYTDGRGNIEPITSDSTAGTIQLGTWVRFRYHVKFSSSFGADDGVMEAWIDSTKILDESGLPMFADTGLTVDPPDNTWDSGYLFGAWNSGVPEDMYFYVDDVSVFSSNPGW